LWTAREKLKQKGGDRKSEEYQLNKSSIDFTWGEYCEEIGIVQQTANRWLNGWFPEQLDLPDKPKICRSNFKDNMEKIKIKIDSREKAPYQFQNSEVGILSIGDYSICGLEDSISIERKELGDLIGCLTSGRERFEKELFKGKALDYFALVIEASLSDIANGLYRSEMQAKAAIQSLLTFSIRYHLPVWFTGSREYGQRVTESLLLKFAREIEKRFERIEKGANHE